MNFNIYVEDQLGEYLNKATEVTGKSKNAIVREAIKEWAENHPMTVWSKEILQHQGIDDFKAFEDSRNELSAIDDDPLK